MFDWRQTLRDAYQCFQAVVTCEANAGAIATLPHASLLEVLELIECERVLQYGRGLVNLALAGSAMLAPTTLCHQGKLMSKPSFVTRV